MAMSDMYGPSDESESVATIHAALAAGIVLLCSKRLSAARRVVRPRIENDSSI